MDLIEKLTKLYPSILITTVAPFPDHVFVNVENNEILDWQSTLPEKTVAEVEAEWAQYLLDNSHLEEEKLNQQRVLTISLLTQAFYAAACTITGEPTLDALKLQQWSDKRALADIWHDAGRPDVTLSSSVYGLVLAEASNRSDALSDPNLLITAWYTNGQAWLQFQTWYWTAFEPQKRAWIRTTATFEDLSALTVESLTAEILAQIPQ